MAPPLPRSGRVIRNSVTLLSPLGDCVSVATLQEHRRPLEFHHNCTVGFLPPAFDSHNASIRSGLRFALLYDLAFGIDRIAMKNGMRMQNFVVTQVCHNCTFG